LTFSTINETKKIFSLPVESQRVFLASKMAYKIKQFESSNSLYSQMKTRDNILLAWGSNDDLEPNKNFEPILKNKFAFYWDLFKMVNTINEDCP